MAQIWIYGRNSDRVCALKKMHPGRTQPINETKAAENDRIIISCIANRPKLAHYHKTIKIHTWSSRANWVVVKVGGAPPQKYMQFLGIAPSKWLKRQLIIYMRALRVYRESIHPKEICIWTKTTLRNIKRTQEGNDTRTDKSAQLLSNKPEMPRTDHRSKNSLANHKYQT